MATEIRVPTLGESVTEATVGKWLKKVGDAVTADEPLVELETDKVAVEAPAPVSGVLSSIDAAEGANVEVGGLLGAIDANGAAAAAKPAKESKAAAAPKPAPRKAESAPQKETEARAPAAGAPPREKPLSPAPRRIVEEEGLEPASIKGTGKDGRVTKGDAIEAAARQAKAPETPAAPRETGPRETDPREERVKMSRLRQTIARRLKEAQENAAMLTTFNDVDMSAVIGLRAQYKELFEKKHGVKLGFMSFFVKACVHALKEVPEVNAEIDGTDIIYKNHYDIGVAVGTERGLVVPVLRDADRMSLADIEKAVADFGKRARDGALTLEEMQGGTFTISNGGVYGSLLSTPILNPPQSGVLGMHRIEERAVVKDGAVVARPMMYLALSYDHRVVDGKGAVTFLVRVKENLEDPQRLMLDL